MCIGRKFGSKIIQWSFLESELHDGELQIIKVFNLAEAKFGAKIFDLGAKFENLTFFRIKKKQQPADLKE